MDFNGINGNQTADWISAFAASFNYPQLPSTSNLHRDLDTVRSLDALEALNALRSLDAARNSNTNQNGTSAASSSKKESPDASANSLAKITPRKVRSYTITQKLEVLHYAKENSINAAHRKYGIDRKCIRDWRKNEAALLSVQYSAPSMLKRRRPGAGRRVMDQEFDDELAKWLKEELEAGQSPSRAKIQWKALELAQQRGVDINTEFKASTGWLEKFLIRHNLHPKSIDLSASYDPDPQPSTSELAMQIASGVLGSAFGDSQNGSLVGSNDGKTLLGTKETRPFAGHTETKISNGRTGAQNNEFGAVEEACRDEYARFLDEIVESIGVEGEDGSGQ